MKWYPYLPSLLPQSRAGTETEMAETGGAAKVTGIRKDRESERRKPGRLESQERRLLVSLWDGATSPWLGARLYMYVKSETPPGLPHSGF